MSSAGGVASLLVLGLILGMKHALEADHLAAVAALATRSRTVRHTVWQGIVWGTGHTLTLVVFGAAVVGLHARITERVAFALEFAVGVMLVALGVDVFRRLRKERIHLHAHSHGDGVVHVHAHSHAHDPLAHDRERHRHVHREGFPLRALCVGMMHGMAGTAALVLVMIGTAKSLALAMAEIAAFGVGSILGMAALSLALAIPLRMSARFFARAYDGLQVLAGLVTLVLGSLIAYQAARQGLGA